MVRSRRRLAAVLGIALLGALLAVAVLARSVAQLPRETASAPESLPAEPPADVAEPPAPSAGPPTRTAPPFLGVDLPTGFYRPDAIEAFSSMVGRPVDVAQAFVSWGYTEDDSWHLFPAGRVAQVLEMGVTPEITWVPTVTGGGKSQPDMRLSTIVAGEHDGYIADFARAAGAADGQLLIRFGHEMNDPGTSFSESQNGNSRGDYARAFRHVHDVFEEQGVTNVRWVWAPNILFPGQESLERWYPGDEYVDWVGVDGYSYPKSGCPSPHELFAETIADIRGFTTKPLMISEVGVAEQCPDKPAWIRDFAVWLEATPQVFGVIWWNRNAADRDYRVDSSPAALSAFRGFL